MSFKAYIKAVGTGPKGNRDLSFEESKDMMLQILQRKATPEQIAAFLIGWRLKSESVEEFCGALSALDLMSVKYDVANSIELGYPFDGKAKNSYLLDKIAQKLLSTKLNLVVSGDELQPAKGGVTTKELFSTSPLANLHYFDRTHYLKELHQLTDLRMLLGLRTGLNTLEKLPAVANSKSALTGVHHKPYVKKYIEIFSSRYERFGLIQGDEGTPELFKKGTLWLSENGVVSEYIIDPAFYGITGVDDLEALAHLNAAILLFVSGECGTIDEAYEFLEK